MVGGIEKEKAKKTM